MITEPLWFWRILIWPVDQNYYYDQDALYEILWELIKTQKVKVSGSICFAAKFPLCSPTAYQSRILK